MYDIDPELKILEKMPVVTRPLEIKLTKHFFRRLMKREVEKRAANTRIFSYPSNVSPKGEVKCIVYSPDDCGDEEILPAVVFYHGGAFIFPAMPYHYRLVSSIAETVRCRVFMSDYDLAPDMRSPGQYEEAYELYRYINENADRFNIDKNRMAVAGDSAGGTLCATLCLMLRDRGFEVPKGQALFYPSLDARLSSDSMKKYTDVPVINSKAVKKYHEICASKGDIVKREYISPVEESDLSFMPAAYIETAEFDCLHDDGVLYYKRLIEAGVDAELNETKGTVHAYDFVKNSAVLRDAMSRRVGFLKRILH